MSRACVCVSLCAQESFDWFVLCVCGPLRMCGMQLVGMWASVSRACVCVSLCLCVCVCVCRGVAWDAKHNLERALNDVVKC